MSNVENESDGLRLFSGQFDKFHEDLYQKAVFLKTRYHSLGTTWQDEQYDRLGEKIDNFCMLVARFLQSTENIPTDLNRLAELIEGGYHGVR